MSRVAEAFHNFTHPPTKPNADADGQPLNLPKGVHVKQDLNDPDLTGNPSQSALEQNQSGGAGSGDRARTSMMEEARQALGFGGGGTAARAGSGDVVIPGGSGEKLVGK